MASGRRRFETRHGREPNTKHGCRIIGTLSKMPIGVRAQSGDCHQFPPLELAGCTRFAPRETAHRPVLADIANFIVRNSAGAGLYRSEEHRVGEECRSRWW